MPPATAASLPPEGTRRPPPREAHPAGHGRPARVGPLLAVSLALNAAFAGVAGYVAVKRPALLSPPQAAAGSPASPAAIVALGRVQPPGGVVNVFGVPGDRVVEVLKPLGSAVEKGDQLLALSGAAERQQSLAVLDAQLGEATRGREEAEKSRAAQFAALDAEVKQAEAKYAADVAAADAKIAGLEAQAGLAAGELERLKDVRAAGVTVAGQDFAKAQAVADGAAAELAAAKEQRLKAAAQREAAKDVAAAKRQTIAAEADRAIALIPFDSLKAGRAAAEQKVADAVVRAPVGGRVVKVGVQAGDTLANLPALQIAPAGPMTVVAEVYETDIARLRDALAGNNEVQVKVTAPALGPKATLTGAVKLDDIAPMIARNAVFALGPREDADRRVIEVTVTLDAASSKLAADFIGLQVRAEFDTSPAAK